MGRKKVSMELITDVKRRNTAFKTRKAGLFKKARELAILCDVNVSMIVFSDLQEKNPEVFHPHLPNDSISAYKSKRVSEPGKIKTYGLRDFYTDRKKQSEEELAKAKKRNLEVKYPTRFGVLDNSSEGELRKLASELGMKIDQLKRRIKPHKTTQNLDAQDFSCKQLSNPMAMMNNDCAVFDHVGYSEWSNPISMMDMLLRSEDENQYYPMDLYGDNQKTLSMQSSNYSNSVLTSESASNSYYNSETYGLPPLPLAMVQPEELQLMQMNSLLGSSFPQQVWEYGYNYLAC